MNDLQMMEWEKWKTLCALLKNSGAITDTDLKSRSGSKETSGQLLLTTIAQWGDLKAELERK